MKSEIQNSLRSFWLPVFLLLSLFFIITVAGNVLVIGSKLKLMHPWSENAFYLSILVLLAWLIVSVAYSLWATPALSIGKEAAIESMDYKQLQAISRQLVRAKELPEDHRNALSECLRKGSALREPLLAALKVQSASAADIIKQQAVVAFLSTAISQNGKLDAVAMLATNIRMINQLVSHFGFRPPLVELCKIHSKILTIALVAEQVDDLDAEGLLTNAGFGLFGAVPGMGLLANSAIDGTINALLTLRVGYVALGYLTQAGEGVSRRETRRVANAQARTQLFGVVQTALATAPGKLKQTIQNVAA